MTSPAPRLLEQVIQEMRSEASDIAVLSDDDNHNAQAAAKSIVRWADELSALVHEQEPPHVVPKEGDASLTARMQRYANHETLYRDAAVGRVITEWCVEVEELERVSALVRETPQQSNYYGKPLTVSVQDGELRISIGVDVLAHAVSYSDWANPYDEDKHEYIRTFAITDAEAFARDARLAMLREQEDGSSPLSDFLDAATNGAVDDGSEACDYEVAIHHGQTAPVETWATAALTPPPPSQQQEPRK